MDDDLNDAAGWLQALVTRSIEEQVRSARQSQQLLETWWRDLLRAQKDAQMQSIQRYVDLLRSDWEGAAPRPPRDGFDRSTSRQTADYVRDVTTVAANYYEWLGKLQRDAYDRLVQQYPPPAQPPVEDAPRPVSQIRMEVNGHVGGDVTRSFVVENKRMAPTHVTVALTGFADSTGRSFRPPLRLEPDEFSLGPLEEQDVILTLQLGDDVFEPGGSYYGSIGVTGDEPLEILLHVVVAPGS